MLYGRSLLVIRFRYRSVHVRPDRKAVRDFSALLSPGQESLLLSPYCLLLKGGSGGEAPQRFQTFLMAHVCPFASPHLFNQSLLQCHLELPHLSSSRD